jgi:hypothetical protein
VCGVVEALFSVTVKDGATSTSSITASSTKSGSKTTSVPPNQSVSSTGTGAAASSAKGAAAPSAVNVGIYWQLVLLLDLWLLCRT